MAGNAKTEAFLLSTATVMIGPKEKLRQLTPEEHSIGLVKNFQFSAEPEQVELTQGIQNDVVASVKTADAMRCSMEVYEYTGRNLAYAAGLDPTASTWDQELASGLLVEEAEAGDVSIVVSTTFGADLSAGDFIYIQEEDDYVHVAEVASVAAGVVTLADGFAIPPEMDFGAGARVGKVRELRMGGHKSQPTFAAKVIGVMPNDDKPFMVYFPKIKIVRGFSVNFQSESFSNLPFEFTPYVQTRSDPFYREYRRQRAILYSAN